MTVYSTGHVKRDPVTGVVAVRTRLPEDDPQLAVMAWRVASDGRVGSRHTSTAEVDGWDDLFNPDE